MNARARGVLYATPDFYYSNYDPKVRPGGRVQHVLHAPPETLTWALTDDGTIFPRCRLVLDTAEK